MDGAAGLDRTGTVGDEEGFPAEAGIALAAVGIEDPEEGPATGRTRPVAGDEDLGRLADHVPAQADPGVPGKLEADPGPLPDRGGHGLDEAGRLKDQEADPGPPGQGGEAAQPIREAGGTLGPGRKVNHEKIHGPAGQERPGDGQALLRPGRGEDDQPFGLDAAGHRLHRIEGLSEVQPGDDGAAGLGLRGEPQGEGGPAARQIASERQAHPAGQAARPQDGIQLREPGGEDPARVRRPGNLPRELLLALRGPRRRPCEPSVRGCQGEGSGNRSRGARCGRSPARAKGRQGRRHVRREGRHQAPSIEHLFE
jgi:hypothetical protein